jgi:hypothetical protein
MGKDSKQQENVPLQSVLMSIIGREWPFHTCTSFASIISSPLIVSDVGAELVTIGNVVFDVDKS